MKCNLIPLLKFRLLNKANPMNPSAPFTEFNQNDVYSLNGGFKHNNYKIKIPVATAKDQSKSSQSQEVGAIVDKDRSLIVEATIVKVMKARRKLEHNALIAEATKILSQKFSPDPTMIKKRIESLIEREYMERDNEDRRFYKYIA